MFAVIVALVALALVLLPARYRKLGFVAAGMVALVFVSTVLLYRRAAPISPMTSEPRSAASAVSRKFDFDQYERDKKDREDPDAQTKIAVAELHFDQVLPIAGVESGTIQAVRARLYNDSRQVTLTDYAYYLLIQDCLQEKADDKRADHCTTVYDQRDFVSLSVPPNQARDVMISIPKEGGGFAPPFKLLGTARVTLTATATRAYQSGSVVPSASVW